jgi:hypothetical protein
MLPGHAHHIYQDDFGAGEARNPPHINAPTGKNIASTHFPQI